MKNQKLVFSPKYMGKMLVGDVAMIEIAVNPDHVHIFFNIQKRIYSSQK